jgi:hypothetical protein
MHHQHICGQASTPLTSERRGTDGGSRLAALDIPPEQIALLRRDLFGSLTGVLEDLRRPERLRDPVGSAAEGAILLRLLEALDQRRVALPDEGARALIGRMAEGYDRANGYGPIVATHDAHRALLSLLGGADVEPGCIR